MDADRAKRQADVVERIIARRFDDREEPVQYPPILPTGDEQSTSDSK